MGPCTSVFLQAESASFLSGMMFTVEMTEKLGIVLPFTPAEFRDILSFPNYVFGYILLIGVLIAILRRLFVTGVRQVSIMYDWLLSQEFS